VITACVIFSPRNASASVFLLLQDHGRDFRRRIGLVADLDVRIAVGRAHNRVGHQFDFMGHFFVLAPHETLDRVDRVPGVRDSLPLGSLPNQPFAGLGERHDRRRGAHPLGIRDHRWLATLHQCHARIRRAQIDSKHFGHLALHSPAQTNKQSRTYIH
jgi:hypothetical protein